MTRMPCHISDELVGNDPADAVDETRCIVCGGYSPLTDTCSRECEADYRAGIRRQAQDAVKRRQWEAMSLIARGLEKAS